MSIWVKICGNTSLVDARMAVEAGADAVGFVFAPSPRRVTPAEVAAITSHLPASIEKIGVFVDGAPEDIAATVHACGLTGVQLHFDADPELPSGLHRLLGSQLRILRVLHFGAETAREHAARISLHTQDRHVDGVLVDSGTASAVGGTGVTFDWGAAREILLQFEEAHKRVVIAGGLNSSNVKGAIHLLHPWGVDAASGVEAAPGRKDPIKVREFVASARIGSAAL